MMANDETYADTTFAKFVAEHEIAHTYMPFYMGINETRYGFMDEGWATTFELLIGRADMGTQKAEEFYKQFRVNGYIYDNSPDEDVPIITPGDDQSSQGLGNNEYGKPSLGYLAMKDMLGDDLFKKCLHAYMDRWHGKHPSPWDFFYTFNDVAGKDMNWFWTNWFFSNNYIDLAVDKVEDSGNGATVSIRNIGGFAIPFNVDVHYSDGSSASYHQTPALWSADPKNASVSIPSGGKKIQSVELNGGIYVDADASNNKWAASHP